ncbi:hypothetical protein ACH4OY_30355 [Micromonospora rubida]|uniref:HEAT repeat domain-containing protein n=1 Tax=Micromonospora rubida TaxID=2697657 RepID=A0ABW7STB1_9ACTN
MGADAFADLAESVGWTEFELDPDSYDSEDYPARLWDVPDGWVRFVEDTVLGIKYVDVDAPSRDVDVVKTAFEARDRDELLQLLDLTGAADDVCRMLRMLARAAQATPFDRRIFDAVAVALDSADEDVQISALAVVGRSRWTQFLPHIEGLTKTSSTRVRAFAANAKVILDTASRMASVADDQLTSRPEQAKRR